MINKNLILIVLICSVLLISGCTAQKIADAKTEQNIGKTIKVSGTVISTLKIGSVSGYTIEDDTGRLAVSSKTLPAEGDKITVKGVLIKDSLLGYYVKVE